jgi:hypothetical protein
MLHDDRLTVGFSAMFQFNKPIIIATFACSLAMLTPCDAAHAENYPVINIEKRENIKVFYDVKDDVWEAGVGKALYYVRGLLESYKSMGVSYKKLHISIVLHGPTAYWLLNEEAYRKTQK